MTRSPGKTNQQMQFEGKFQLAQFKYG